MSMLELLYKLFLERDTSSLTRAEEAVVGKDYSDDPPRGFWVDYGVATVSFETTGGSLVEDMAAHGVQAIRPAKFLSIDPIDDVAQDGSVRTPRVFVGW